MHRRIIAQFHHVNDFMNLEIVSIKRHTKNSLNDLKIYAHKSKIFLVIIQLLENLFQKSDF